MSVASKVIFSCIDLFSFVEPETSFATGASLTAATVMVTVDMLLSAVPSLAL